MTSKPHPRLNAHQFSRIYGDLGIDLDQLGCIMLDLEPAKASMMLDLNVTPDELYVSEHPDRSWLRDMPVLTKAHVTLLYGLLGPDALGAELDHQADQSIGIDVAGVTADHVDQALDGWVMPERVVIDNFEVFPSPYGPGDPDHQAYACIVARVDPAMNPAILEAHQRLSFLPHIDTHAEYTAHITMAYVKNDPEIIERWVANLAYPLVNKQLDLKPKGLDYGTTIGATR